MFIISRLTPTPKEWLAAAAAELSTLLIDHAHCEHQAALSALSLMKYYHQQPDKKRQFAQFAREEILHYEQVIALMEKHAIAWQNQSPSRYARRMAQYVRRGYQQQHLDELLIAAVIEARSCERFMKLADVLPAEIGDYYRRLAKAEQRHADTYWHFAADLADQATCLNCLEELIAIDHQLITSGDTQLRFHSGIPH